MYFVTAVHPGSFRTTAYLVVDSAQPFALDANNVNSVRRRYGVVDIMDLGRIGLARESVDA